ncbi:putative Dyslexia susceptibility 1-like protein [Hypsibius exemplaris]|uniref:Dyslexia susceptibility 1-like protein n=1 Tax=Hypsibius exemplaris TaxID=2072580 RepID=A0A1W0WM35_HYPEX|nr:putative Dyslexia susceptibility 1-like protein [Hypsibius exemplaris]
MMRAIRQEALDFSLQRSRLELERRKATKQETHKFAVNVHMDAEAARIRNIAARKELDKAEALAGFDFSDGLSRIRKEQLEPVAASLNPPSIPDEALEELFSRIAEVDKRKTEGSQKAKARSRTKTLALAKRPGAVRSCGTISFTSTPRHFPTPQRESQVLEEETWLRKQADYRKVLDEPDSACSRTEERDPLWLKEKGDFFLAAGDYNSAIACYSRAAQLGSNMPEIYMNRALAHFHKNNLHKVLEDSSKALDTYPESVETSRKERTKAHWRRALAFLKMDLMVESLIEFEGALKTGWVDENLVKQRHVVKSLIEGTGVDSPLTNSVSMFSGLVSEKS